LRIDAPYRRLAIIFRLIVSRPFDVSQFQLLSTLGNIPRRFIIPRHTQLFRNLLPIIIVTHDRFPRPLRPHRKIIPPFRSLRPSDHQFGPKPNIQQSIHSSFIDISLHFRNFLASHFRNSIGKKTIHRPRITKPLKSPSLCLLLLLPLSESRRDGGLPFDAFGRRRRIRLDGHPLGFVLSFR